MAEGHPRGIHFGCPRCQARLVARRAQAGTRRRCPRCQLVFPVPTAEEAAARAPKTGPEAEYPLSQRGWSSTLDPVEKKHVSFSCPLCKTRMYAEIEQVGQTMQCPDCDTPVVVPPPREIDIHEVPLNQIDPAEEYPLWGVGQPPREVKEVYQNYIPVVCGVCHTRMLATEDQVGQPLTCPDCGTQTTVPPAPAKPAELICFPPLGQEGDIYALNAQPGSPAAGAAAAQTYIPVVCSLCHTRLHATADQVGQKLTCPDCGTQTTVPPPAAPLPKIDPMGAADQGYAVGEAVTPPPWEPIFECSWAEGEEETTAQVSDRDRKSRLKPARSPRSAGFAVWTFPLYPDVLIRWAACSAGAILALALAMASVALSAVETLAHYMVSMTLSGAAGVIAAIWLAGTAATLLAVVVDTAAGNERVENWPEGIFLDWLFDAFYGLNALAVAALPGVALAGVVGKNGLWGKTSIAGSVFVLFPVVLLSMLERGSALKPLSGKIAGSLLSAWGAWVLFYVQSALLVAGTGTVAIAATSALGNGGVLACVPVLVAAMLIYSRLLGRLGWVCAAGRAKSD